MTVPTALTGCQVERTAFDYQVRLTLIALDPDEGHRVDAELVVEAPVLDLFMKTITTAEIRKRGARALTFDDGCELFVSADPQFESWHLTGNGVDPITIGPGGHTDWQQAD